MNNHQELKQAKASLRLVCLITLIGYLGASIAYPILPVLFMHPGHHGIISNQLNFHWRGIWLGMTLAMYPLGQFFGAPIIGAASDRFGRKNTLITTLIAACIGYLITIMALMMQNLALLIISRLVTGVMEGNIAIARSIAIDLKAIPKQASLGKINAISAIGYIIGPIVGGLLSDPHLFSGFNYATPFYLAIITTITGAILTSCFLKESHAPSNNARISLSEFNAVNRVRKLCKNPLLTKLLLASTVFTLAIDIFYEFGPVFLTSQWNMSASMIAIYNLVLSATLSFGSLLPHWLSKRFSIYNMILTGIISTTAILASIILFNNQMITMLLFFLSGITITIVIVNLTVLLSDSADESIQGEVMGTQLGLRMLGDGIICILGGLIMMHSASIPILASSMIALSTAFVLKKRTISSALAIKQ